MIRLTVTKVPIHTTIIASVVGSHQVSLFAADRHSADPDELVDGFMCLGNRHRAHCI